MDALMCVPLMKIEDIPTEVPGVSHVLVRMSFLFGATSSRYYADMDAAINGSYSHLRITVYDTCHIIERERGQYHYG